MRIARSILATHESEPRRQRPLNHQATSWRLADRNRGHGMTIDPNLGILICSHVFQKTRPVLLVSRPNSDLQLLCGDVHKDRPHGVCIGHLLERDPSLHEVVDLPIGWEAERKGQGGPWIRSRCQDGEEHRFANPAPMDGSFRRRLRNCCHHLHARR
jgi:hypothetical protein